jgi:soluble lytic murein transglycosylase-like protein
MNMDINAEIARVQARIAQIVGAPDNDPSPSPGELKPNDPRSQAFSSMVNQAMGEGEGAEGAPAALPPAEIEQLVQSNAATWQVDPALVRAVMANESGFNPKATSKTGAQGLMQLEPETASSLGVTDAYDPQQNVWGGTRYLRGLLDRFGGDLTKAIAAYNAGPGAVEKYGGVPPYAETQSYVKNVLDSYQQYTKKSP